MAISSGWAFASDLYSTQHIWPLKPFKLREEVAEKGLLASWQSPVQSEKQSHASTDGWGLTPLPPAYFYRSIVLPDQSLQQGSKGEPLLQPKEEPQKAALPISVDSSVSVKAEPVSEWSPPADESLTLCGISIPEGDEAAEASSPSSQKSSVATEVVVAAFPKRPGEPLCDYFVRTGHCRFGESCRFDHPAEFAVPLNRHGLPIRPGEPVCSFFERTGECKFGGACKFHHP